MGKRGENGFTLVEMLVVIAIIGVLVGIAMPTFSTQADEAKLRTDQANMRSGEAAALVEYLSGGYTSKKRFYFDAGTGTASASSVPGAYGQLDRELTDDEGVNGIPVSGTPAGNYLTLVVGPSGVESMQWGGTGTEYDKTRMAIASKDVALSTVDGDDRIEADADGLRRLANMFVGMTESQLRTFFSSDTALSDAKRGYTRLLAYNATSEAGQIRMTGYHVTTCVEAIGSAAVLSEPYQAYGQTWVNVDSRVFFSDYMAVNQSGQDRKVNLHVDVVDGVVTSATIIVSNQGTITDAVPEQLQSIVSDA